MKRESGDIWHLWYSLLALSAFGDVNVRPHIPCWRFYIILLVFLEVFHSYVWRRCEQLYWVNLADIGQNPNRSQVVANKQLFNWFSTLLDFSTHDGVNWGDQDCVLLPGVRGRGYLLQVTTLSIFLLLKFGSADCTAPSQSVTPAEYSSEELSSHHKLSSARRVQHCPALLTREVFITRSPLQFWNKKFKKI